MEIKKNPKSNLENYSKIFMQIGLVLALFVTYAAIEQKTYDRTFGDLGMANMSDELEEEIPITERIEQPKPKTPPPPAPEKIEVVEDEKEVEETVIESTETDETEAVEVEDIVEEEEEEEIVGDVNFMVIENVPVFPGCKGSNTELRKCFSKKVQKHFTRKFDAELPNELGLSPGRKRVSIQFVIDRSGKVTNIMARAPHPKIKKEVLKVMNKLPKMTPGKQRGKPVGVKYAIPFTLIVE
ncbi:outer membrane transport energization protein TonB (TC 2.C.1.1.1) [Lutibacter sp. Hel_I_33_5]|uniref:energy transducer TonB n=1 Tax=Lutibacter sp. Hel_I_33_5 TaxID=1566289 RepID=UPI0011A9EF07|nr:energy transducer TonB [Lutibacter sp. Hel_I_33_5]TVZ56526.1 outer membrane transport energization protein TonB (TC 2.C.1.1.1) [Lutibacter sp. Hel_I_33_5]